MTDQPISHFYLFFPFRFYHFAHSDLLRRILQYDMHLYDTPMKQVIQCLFIHSIFHAITLCSFHTVFGCELKNKIERLHQGRMLITMAGCKVKSYLTLLKWSLYYYYACTYETT